MTIRICPHCNARYTVMNNTGDFSHDCDIPEADSSARKEDILVTQVNYEDFDGSGGKPPGEIMLQSIQNTLWGTRAALEGE